MENAKKEVKTTSQRKPKLAPKINPDQLVEVYSNVLGKLVYKPMSQLGGSYVWDSFGQFRIMTVKELVDMANSQRAFFENQWVKIHDDAVLEYIRAKHYYDKEVTEDTIKGHLLESSPDALEKFISEATQYVKIKIVAMARELIKTGELSNFRTVDILEKRFGVELREAV